jgi:hypothetical protein
MATEAARLECKATHRKEGENRKRKTSLQERRRKTFLTLTGLLMEGLEQIVAVSKNHLALATHPEEKTCQFSRLAFVCWWRFPNRSTKG